MQPSPPPPSDVAPAPPPPPAPIIAAAPKAFPAAPATPPVDAPSDRTESPGQSRFGNFSSGARDEVAAGSAESTARRASVRSVAEAPVAAKSESAAADQAARLRAAAAAGKTAEVEGLLAAGVPIDAADANGDTALIRSIQADQPSVAAILHRHGASLDRENNAGQSARDIAKAKDDAELNQALGLAP